MFLFKLFNQLYLEVSRKRAIISSILVKNQCRIKLCYVCYNTTEIQNRNKLLSADLKPVDQLEVKFNAKENNNCD